MLLKISIEAPINPSVTPMTWVLVEVILNIASPIRTVFKGTKEFKIETIPLSTSVSANANRKDGKNVPKNPVTIIHFHWWLSIVLRDLNPIIKINSADITVLKLPNCKGERPRSPFLIKIKELPHVIANSKRKNHFFLFCIH